jgi:DNA polymerase I
MKGLEQYRAVIVIDFEFYTGSNHDHVRPICVSAKDLISGQKWRAWLWDDPAQMPELPTGPDVLYVSYSAPAEWSCYLAMGLELPQNILDLYAFHRVSKNGWKELRRGKTKDKATGEAKVLKAKPSPLKCSLLTLMDESGLRQLAMDAESKERWRALTIRGGPYTPEEQAGILDYCDWDVVDLELLLPVIVERPDFNLDVQLFLGDFTRVLAWMDYNGIPVDVPMCYRLMAAWPKILRKFAEQMEAKHHYNVIRYDPETGRPSLDEKLYAACIEREGFANIFPLTKSGKKFSTSTSKKRKEQPNLRTFALDHDRFKGMLELVEFLNDYKNFTLPIGSDGRLRAGNAPWEQTTGRVTPRGSHLFRMHAYFRYLIVPPPGRALAYVDLKAAEYGIGAALSGDVNMRATYVDVLEGRAEKPYLVTGKKLGILPPDATSKHPGYKMCKAAELAMGYGQTPIGCAKANNIPEQAAEDYFIGHRDLYPDYWRYVFFRIHEARGEGIIRTPFGYSMQVHRHVKQNSLLNWPMQSTCAEIMRIAAARMLDEGLSICVTVHDAVLVEADAKDIDAHAEVAQECWRWASERVLGFKLDADVKVIREGERYEDDDGTDGWNQLMKWLQEVEAESVDAAKEAAVV